MPDAEAIPILQQLQKEEGIAVGSSAGINVAGAMRVARELGPGHTIVTMLCDRADRYAGKVRGGRRRRRRRRRLCCWTIVWRCWW